MCGKRCISNDALCTSLCPNNFQIDRFFFSSPSTSLLLPSGPGHRLGDVSGSVVLSAPSLVGDTYGDGGEGVGTGVDSAIFQVPHM